MANTTWGKLSPMGVAAGLGALAVGYWVLTKPTPKQRAQREREAAKRAREAEAQRKRDERAEMQRRRTAEHTVNRARAHQVTMQRKARRLGFAS